MIDFQHPDLKVSRQGPLGILTLNRPQILNALSLEMIRMIRATLERWSKDDTLKAVLFLGAGDRAFCAGGDVKAAYYTGMEYRRGTVIETVVSLYFAEEYDLNQYLMNYQKPLVAYMDGVTMGGGFGIAGPCDFRLATDRTYFAMPEVIIGLFPDVGSAWFLTRCPGETGTYLALTGLSIQARDMMYVGLATHYVRSHQQAPLIKALETAAADKDPQMAIAKALTNFTLDPMTQEEGAIEANRARIDTCFSFDTIEDIYVALSEETEGWERSTRHLLESRSPTSLKVTLAHLRRARAYQEDFATIIKRDYTLAHNFLRGHDFYEGVRAMIINKDRQPQWEPKHFSEVTDDVVRGHFVQDGLGLLETVYKQSFEV